MKKFNLKLIFSTRKFTILISVFSAVIAWFVTVVFSDSYSSVVVYNVPINLAACKTKLEQLGLDIIKSNPSSVSVKIRGPRYKIGLINKDEVLVTPAPDSLNDINSKGEYILNLKSCFKNAQRDVEIEEVNAKSINLNLDVLETKSINLTANIKNIEVERGFVMDRVFCQPENLSVSGPKSFMDRLDHVALVVNSNFLVLNSSKTFDAVEKFISVDGDEMDKTMFKYSDVKFSVTVPVFKEKQVPLTFKYKNAPECFSTSLLKPKINPDSVKLGAANDLIQNIKEIELGYIDMRELQKDKIFKFNIAVPAGFKNLSEFKEATVSFDFSNLDYRVFAVRDIRLNNIPDNFNVSVVSPEISDVKIVGFPEQIKALNDENLIAVVNLLNIPVKNGKQNVLTNIQIVNNDGVWPVGEYFCTIKISEN